MDIYGPGNKIGVGSCSMLTAPIHMAICMHPRTKKRLCDSNRVYFTVSTVLKSAPHPDTYFNIRRSGLNIISFWGSYHGGYDRDLVWSGDTHRGRHQGDQDCENIVSSSRRANCRSGKSYQHIQLQRLICSIGSTRALYRPSERNT
jgi:hypothetical protein